ncbi:ankyrin repeat domain-containing protein [Candidatus Neptunochlamydia vexilliferae]|uniref:Ankyrin repeat protein n=1 Tax=Candidatus Neptunichlamydia vexilliferae TaxID=1651774 RepID=A0ABS0AX02_9BACT|nr:ankyrin repeat domain-containing protein [Candidatus Neptunochlamydia vexilliferae]MBF5058646.1 hypothetical protein [Candidatus Neptunochlamydia vexilliferae]
MSSSISNNLSVASKQSLRTTFFFKQLPAEIVYKVCDDLDDKTALNFLQTYFKVHRTLNPRECAEKDSYWFDRLKERISQQVTSPYQALRYLTNDNPKERSVISNLLEDSYAEKGNFIENVFDAFQQGTLHLSSVKELSKLDCKIIGLHLYHSQAENLPFIKHLIDGGVNVNKKCSSLKLRPLHCSAILCSVKTTQFLINHGAKIRVDEDEISPIHCQWIGEEVGPELDFAKNIDLLIKNGSDIESTVHPKGYTPLMCAIKYDHLESIKILIKNGAKVNHPIPIKGGNLTAFQFALKSRFIDSKMTLILLKAGAELTFDSFEIISQNHKLSICEVEKVFFELLRWSIQFNKGKNSSKSYQEIRKTLTNRSEQLAKSESLTQQQKDLAKRVYQKLYNEIIAFESSSSSSTQSSSSSKKRGNSYLTQNQNSKKQKKHD